MQSQDFEMSIIVGNKSITEYHHEGSIYVEGRKGSEYTIRLRNKSGTRACFVLSVDGLSVLDGQEAGNASPGYVLSGWETLDVACYKVDTETGAKFEFGSKGKSYSAQSGHGTNNVGVIAALVFKEKTYIYRPYPLHNYGCFGGIGASGTGGVTGIPRSWTGGGSQPQFGMASSSIQCSTHAQNTNTAGAAPASAAPTKSATPAATADSFEQQALGTSFGDAMNWRTTTVSFERESNAPNASLVIFYDSKKNLEQRGVEFKKKVPALPDPFPANAGCPVPPGWRK